MIFNLSDSISRTLLNMPETGMGYQVINARLANNWMTQRLVVYNSDLAIEDDNDFLTNKIKLIREGYRDLKRVNNILTIDVNSISLLNENQIKQYKSTQIVNSVRSLNRSTGISGAIDSPSRRCDGIEEFVRVSAYEDDKRIDFINKKLLSGTFATTFEDYKKCVTDKDEPVDRYALPNDEQIRWAFYVRPTSLDTVQIGTVQPAFNHKGGGIEAYFANGTSNNTYLRRVTYGS